MYTLIYIYIYIYIYIHIIKKSMRIDVYLYKNIHQHYIFLHHITKTILLEYVHSFSKWIINQLFHVYYVWNTLNIEHIYNKLDIHVYMCVLVSKISVPGRVIEKSIVSIVYLFCILYIAYIQRAVFIEFCFILSFQKVRKKQSPFDFGKNVLSMTYIELYFRPWKNVLQIHC